MRLVLFVVLSLFPSLAFALEDAIGYKGRFADQALEALFDFELIVARGEARALIGPSGSGKSTLLRMVGKLEDPTGQNIKVTVFDMGRGEFGEITVRGGIDFSTMPSAPKMAPGGMYIGLGQLPFYVSVSESSRLAEIAMLIAVMRKIDKALGDKQPADLGGSLFDKEIYLGPNRDVDLQKFELPDTTSASKVDYGGSTQTTTTSTKSTKKKPANAAADTAADNAASVMQESAIVTGTATGKKTGN